MGEIIANEVVYWLVVAISCTLALIETVEDLWRGDEPSPTRTVTELRHQRTAA